MKVLYLTNIPSPYRLKYFDYLAKMCDLTVAFERKESDERDESWAVYKTGEYKAIFLKGVNTSADSALSIQVLKIISNNFDHIVVTDISSPTGMLAVFWMQLNNIAYEIEGDGGFPGSGKGLKERVKTRIISRATICFSTSKTHDKYYIRYGATDKVIYRYLFSPYYSCEIYKDLVDATKKKTLKNKLGLTKKVVLTVGSFIHRKGFDILLKASDVLPDDWCVCFVGGEPTEEYLNIVRKKKKKNVYFCGFKSGNQLAEYYDVADIFVLPTREDIWGLVVNEALSHGLPVVTTNKCIAGEELITCGLNGFIIPADDVKALSEKLMLLTDKTNAKMLNEMKVNSLERIKEYSIENMVECHMKAWIDKD